jgi:dipeptidyl aminopeptidase/acylaminoacyl peptidase
MIWRPLECYLSSLLVTFLLFSSGFPQDSFAEKPIVPPDQPTAEEAKALIALGKELPGRIVFDSNRSGTFGIFSIKTDGTDLRTIVDDAERHEMYPDVSPNQRYVAYTRAILAHKKSQSSIWIADLDGKNPRKLADWGTSPTFSSDGKTIFFERTRKKVMAIDIDGSNEREIFPLQNERFSAVNVVKPRVSADGKYLAFISNTPTPWTAWYVELANGDVEPIGTGCEPVPFTKEAAFAWVAPGGLPEPVKGGAAIAKFSIPTQQKVALQDLPPPRGHEYFPNIVQNDGYLIYSSCRDGEHDPFTSNYQLFMKNLQTGKTVRITFDEYTNRWGKFVPNL